MTLALGMYPAASADELFRAEFARRAAAGFAVRHAEPEDERFLRRLFAEVYAEATRRAGADPASILESPLMAIQFASQRASYAEAYPLACHYIVTPRGAAHSPLGRMLVDWSGAGPVTGIDVAVLPSTRRGAVGLHLLRSWVAVCDRLGRSARLQVMPENPARALYRKLGFAETDALAFPVPMLRPPRTALR